MRRNISFTTQDRNGHSFHIPALINEQGRIMLQYRNLWLPALKSFDRKGFIVDTLRKIPGKRYVFLPCLRAAREKKRWGNKQNDGMPYIPLQVRLAEISEKILENLISDELRSQIECGTIELERIPASGYTTARYDMEIRKYKITGAFTRKLLKTIRIDLKGVYPVKSSNKTYWIMECHKAQEQAIETPRNVELYYAFSSAFSKKITQVRASMKPRIMYDINPLYEKYKDEKEWYNVRFLSVKDKEILFKKENGEYRKTIMLPKARANSISLEKFTKEIVLTKK